jgi:diacylglycerol kinase family enzyme
MKLSLKWRFAAALALVTFLAMVGVVLLAILTRPWLLLGLAAISVGFLYSSWLIFTGTKRRQRYGWGLLIISLVMLAIGVGLYLSGDNDLRRLALVIGLGAIYVSLVQALRERYWVQKRAIAQKTKSTASFRQPVLIINPKSGNGRAIKAGIDKRAKALGIKVIITKKGDSIEGLARQAVADGVDVLGVSGGDGTLGAVAKVALEHDLPLVILPGGTRCHFARDAGFDPERITDALASFHGIERPVSVGVINGRVFLNNASFGLYADIVDSPDYRDHKVATSRKVLQSILEGDRPAYDLHFRDQAGKQHRRAVQILVGVNPYETLNLIELGHRKSLSTGQLQVTVVTKLDDTTIAQLMTTITLKQLFTSKLPTNFLQWETTNFRVTSKSRQIVVGVDGEREKYDSPVTISLYPTQLRLMVPAEGMRGRTITPLNMATIKRLWQVFRHGYV